MGRFGVHGGTDYKPPKRIESQRPRGNTTERGYGRAWQVLADQIMKRDCHLCQPCLADGRLELADEVDHKTPKKLGGTDRPENLQAICTDCHKAKTKRESGTGHAAVPKLTQKPVIPVTVVCGPPGSGKTTYVRERAGPADLVLDLDEIQSRLSGRPMYAYGDEWLRPALAERNIQLARLSGHTPYARCWLIVGSPKWSERRTWRDMLNASVIVLAVGPDECLRRIQADTRRTGQDWEPMVSDWWQRYVPGRDETVIR